MNINWKIDNQPKHQEKSTASRVSQIEIKRISIGFRDSEIFVKFDDTTIIVPPATAKKLAIDLKKDIDSFEAENGVIKVPKTKKSKSGQSLPNLLKSLYKSRKVTKKLISVNTRRKK